jgi:hypothetical protein
MGGRELGTKIINEAETTISKTDKTQKEEEGFNFV